MQTVSVRRAIWIGLFLVNGPVLVFLAGPLFLFDRLIEAGWVSREHNWLGLVAFAAGLVVAWAWWSVSIVRWRLWAYERVQDIKHLKEEAVSVGLTWPDGHIFSKTEIKSKTQSQRERELDPPDQEAVDDE